MKRFFPLGTLVVLVVTACGAGAKPAPRVTEVGARVQSVRVIAARRERAATREARKLLHEFLPPPGARRVGTPHDYGGVLRRSGPTPLSGEVVDVHRFWRVQEPLRAVVAFVRAHDPHGFRRLGATYGSEQPHYLTRSLARGGRGRPTRYLYETIVALPGRTLIRVDAQAPWIYPRSTAETVPAATTEIVVRAPRISATVSDPAKVARVVRWFDALPISPPGVAVLCPLGLPPDLTLSFRSARGAWLARATMPRAAATICDPIGFTIGGKRLRPLIDGDSGESFVRRLQSLLGLHLLRI